MAGFLKFLEDDTDVGQAPPELPPPPGFVGPPRPAPPPKFLNFVEEGESPGDPLLPVPPGPPRMAEQLVSGAAKGLTLGYVDVPPPPGSTFAGIPGGEDTTRLVGQIAGEVAPFLGAAGVARRMIGAGMAAHPILKEALIEGGSAAALELVRPGSVQEKFERAAIGGVVGGALGGLIGVFSQVKQMAPDLSDDGLEQIFRDVRKRVSGLNLGDEDSKMKVAQSFAAEALRAHLRAADEKSIQAVAGTFGRMAVGAGDLPPGFFVSLARAMAEEVTAGGQKLASTAVALRNPPATEAKAAADVMRIFEPQLFGREPLQIRELSPLDQLEYHPTEQDGVEEAVGALHRQFAAGRRGQIKSLKDGIAEVVDAQTGESIRVSLPKRVVSRVGKSWFNRDITILPDGGVVVGKRQPVIRLGMAEDTLRRETHDVANDANLIQGFHDINRVHPKLGRVPTQDDVLAAHTRLKQLRPDHVVPDFAPPAAKLDDLVPPAAAEPLAAPVPAVAKPKRVRGKKAAAPEPVPLPEPPAAGGAPGAELPAPPKGVRAKPAKVVASRKKATLPAEEPLPPPPVDVAVPARDITTPQPAISEGARAAIAKYPELASAPDDIAAAARRSGDNVQETIAREAATDTEIVTLPASRTLAEVPESLVETRPTPMSEGDSIELPMSDVADDLNDVLGGAQPKTYEPLPQKSTPAPDGSTMLAFDYAALPDVKHGHVRMFSVRPPDETLHKVMTQDGILMTNSMRVTEEYARRFPKAELHYVDLPVKSPKVLDRFRISTRGTQGKIEAEFGPMVDPDNEYFVASGAVAKFGLRNINTEPQALPREATRTVRGEKLEQVAAEKLGAEITKRYTVKLLPAEAKLFMDRLVGPKGTPAQRAALLDKDITIVAKDADAKETVKWALDSGLMHKTKTPNKYRLNKDVFNPDGSPRSETDLSKLKPPKNCPC